jgi:hypothetical protein
MLCLSCPAFLFEIASLIRTKLRAGSDRKYYQENDFSSVSLKCEPNQIVYLKKAKASQEINHMQVLLCNRKTNEKEKSAIFFNKRTYVTNEENVIYDCQARPAFKSL